MKKTLTILFLLAFATTCYAADYVNGYMRKNGTYVQGYYKTSPDYTKMNNFSTKGNYNPYTGKTGTVNYTPYVRTNTYNPYRPYKSKIAQPNY